MPAQDQLMEIISIQTEIAKLGLDLPNVMQLVTDRTLSLIGADGAAIELAEGDEMVYRATAGSAQSQIGLRIKRDASLSGLANRALFMDRLRTLTSPHAREQKAAGILMIDLNGLKQVNDSFGHRAGDAMIKEAANRLKQVARQSDTVARLGGDEFGAILSPVEVENGIQAAIDRIKAETASPFQFENRTFQLSASIGAAHFPDESVEIEHLIELADQRMYEVKRRHHDRTRPEIH